MIICIPKENTLQIMAKNEYQSSNLRMPVESYKTIFPLMIGILIYDNDIIYCLCQYGLWIKCKKKWSDK